MVTHLTGDLLFFFSSTVIPHQSHSGIKVKELIKCFKWAKYSCLTILSVTVIESLKRWASSPHADGSKFRLHGKFGSALWSFLKCSASRVAFHLGVLRGCILGFPTGLVLYYFNCRTDNIPTFIPEFETIETLSTSICPASRIEPYAQDTTDQTPEISSPFKRFNQFFSVIRLRTIGGAVGNINEHRFTFPKFANRIQRNNQ